jgi:hypothetical protein
MRVKVKQRVLFFLLGIFSKNLDTFCQAFTELRQRNFLSQTRIQKII